MSERENEKALDVVREEHSERPAGRKPWETPVLEELAVQLSAFNPGVGGDGGTIDLAHS